MKYVENFRTWVKEKVTQYTEFVNEFLNKEEQYKILVIGEEGVGKTSFCNRMVNNEFNLEIKPSGEKSTQYHYSKKLFEDLIQINFIDVSHTLLSSESPNLYLNAKGVFMLYDVTDHKSFDKIDIWIMNIRRILGRKIPIVIIGNKNDLNFLKSVHIEELKEKATNLNCDFAEVSCTTIKDVENIVEFLLAKIYFLNLPENKKVYFYNFFKS